MSKKEADQTKKRNIEVIKEEIKRSKYTASILKLNAMETLILVDRNIYKLVRYTLLYCIDQDLIDTIDELKKPLVEAAKKEMSIVKKEMKDNNSIDAYRSYISIMNKKGLNLLETAEEEQEDSFETKLKEVGFDSPIEENNLYQSKKLQKLMTK